jgi:hypothetical protein
MRRRAKRREGPQRSRSGCHGHIERRQRTNRWGTRRPEVLHRRRNRREGTLRRRGHSVDGRKPTKGVGCVDGLGWRLRILRCCRGTEIAQRRKPTKTHRRCYGRRRHGRTHHGHGGTWSPTQRVDRRRPHGRQSAANPSIHQRGRPTERRDGRQRTQRRSSTCRRKGCRWCHGRRRLPCHARPTHRGPTNGRQRTKHRWTRHRCAHRWRPCNRWREWRGRHGLRRGRRPSKPYGWGTTSSRTCHTQRRWRSDFGRPSPRTCARPTTGLNLGTTSETKPDVVRILLATPGTTDFHQRLRVRSIYPNLQVERNHRRRRLRLWRARSVLHGAAICLTSSNKPHKRPNRPP